jgi:hypothetical protein
MMAIFTWIAVSRGASTHLYVLTENFPQVKRQQLEDMLVEVRLPECLPPSPA